MQTNFVSFETFHAYIRLLDRLFVVYFSDIRQCGSKQQAWNVALDLVFRSILFVLFCAFC